MGKIIPFPSLKLSCRTNLKKTKTKKTYLAASVHCWFPGCGLAHPTRSGWALCFAQQNDHTPYTSHVSRGRICACRVWLGLLCFCHEKEPVPGNVTPSSGTRNTIRDALWRPGSDPRPAV